MNELENHLRDITEIRAMMEKSSKFLSLSGLSGISAGLIALAGTGIVYSYTGGNPFSIMSPEIQWKLAGIAILVLIAALSSAVFFSIRMAKKKGISAWVPGSKYLLTSLLIPLISGGLFCLILLSQGIFYLTYSVTLLFYGVSLLNAAKYTFEEVHYLGIAQIGIGLLAAIWPVYGLLFWGFGFGILHIIYGTMLYLKYEK
jgi:hypothetical protein